MDFHIGVIQTIWWLNLTSFPGCTGAHGKPEFKLYWGSWWSSSQHHREPWGRQTVARLVSSAQQGHFVLQVGAFCPVEPPKNLPSPSNEMQTCKGPQARAQRLKTPTPLTLQGPSTKCLYCIPSTCKLAFCDPKASLNSPLRVLRVSGELVFCSSKDKKHLHSGFNYNWRWKENQKLEELKLRRKRWAKSGVVAFVPVSSCKHFKQMPVFVSGVCTSLNMNTSKRQGW